jgi:3-dehydroquinate synthase
MIELMFHDKKNENELINFSLIPSIGKCEINKTASPDLIKEALKYYSEKVKLLK